MLGKQTAGLPCSPATYKLSPCHEVALPRRRAWWQRMRRRAAAGVESPVCGVLAQYLQVTSVTLSLSGTGANPSREILVLEWVVLGTFYLLSIRKVR